MFGNKLGWGISGVLVLMMIGMLFLIDAASATSPPTPFTAVAENMGPVALPTDPKTVVEMNESCDAGDLYKQAITDYEHNSNRYDRFVTPTAGMDLNEGLGLKGVQLVLKAKDCANMTLFSSMPEKVITYGNKPELDALRNIGKVTNNVGLLLKAAGREGEAVKYHEAVFAMGAKLYAERIAYWEFQLGLELMSTAIGTDKSTGSMMGLAKASGNETRAKELEIWRNEYLEYDRDHIRPVWRVISTIDQDVIRKHTGDIFEIANRSQEPMWRIEAILKLGRMKYDVGGGKGRFGDQMGAKRYVKAHVNDSDPLIKLAAQAAKDLTIEQYRAMH